MGAAVTTVYYVRLRLPIAATAGSHPAQMSVPPETEQRWTSPKAACVHSNMGAVSGEPVDITTRRDSKGASLTVVVVGQSGKR